MSVYVVRRRQAADPAADDHDMWSRLHPAPPKTPRVTPSICDGIRTGLVLAQRLWSCGARTGLRWLSVDKLGGSRRFGRLGVGLAHVVRGEVLGNAEQDQAEADLFRDHPQRVEPRNGSGHESDDRKDLAEQPQPRIGPVET